jgi:3-oxoacyl-[acyl-carrier-protein] synthase-3
MAGAAAIDVGSACSGFLSGLALGAGLIESGRAGTVLLIGADLMSRVIDHQDRRTAGLFGDGAGAAVLTWGGAGRIGPIVMRSDGAGADLVTATHAERVLRMRGQDTFRTAVDRIGLSTMEALDAAGLTLADIDLFVYHQANARILAAVGDRLGLPSDRVVDCIGRYGNTSAASIPIALCEAEQEGRLLAGHRVLVGAFAAGLTWGAGVLEWGAEA